MSTEFPTPAEVLRQHRLVTWSWPTRYQCECGWVSPEADCTRTDHPEHVQDVWREVRMIRTVEQLDALPEHSVIIVLDGSDEVNWKTTSRNGSAEWWTPGSEESVGSSMAMLPALLIHRPDWSK